MLRWAHMSFRCFSRAGAHLAVSNLSFLAMATGTQFNNLIKKETHLYLDRVGVRLIQEQIQ